MVHPSKISFSWLPCSKTPLDGTFEALWSVWRGLGMPFRTLLGTLFGMLTGVHGQEIRFCLPHLLYFGLFCGIGIIFDVFGCIFGSILITLTEGSRCVRDLCAGRYLCDSIANYGLQSHVMSSDESIYMPYNSTARPAILDMPLAQTPQFSIGCGVQG